MDLRLIIIGSITGFLSAFFGIGGSSIDTPVLRIFIGLPPHVALGTPLPLAVLTASIASLVYRRGGLINRRVAWYSLLGGLPGMVLGSYLTAFISGRSLMLLTAVVLFLVGIDFVVKAITGEGVAMRESPSPPPPWCIVVVGFAVGLLSGLLANGGGILLVPAYVLLFGMEIKEAIATSLITVIFLALPGSIVHYTLGHIDLRITFSMAAGLLPMAYLGAKLDIRTRSETIAILYGVVLMLFSGWFFMSQWRG